MNEKQKNNMKFLYFVSLDWLSSSSSTGNIVIENPMRMKLEKWIKPIEEKVESANYNREMKFILISQQTPFMHYNWNSINLIAMNGCCRMAKVRAAK